MSRMPVIAFRPTAEQYQKFKALQTDGRSMSDIVKELVDKGLGSPLPVAPVVATNKVSHQCDSVKPEKKRWGWGWLWWLLVAAIVLGAIWLLAQVQLYYWSG